MARARDPNREKAKQMYLESSGEKPLKDIATELGKSDSQIRKWKNQDHWDDELNGNVTNETKGNVTNERNDISWVEIETEYITDIRKKPCTLKELAKKYGMSASRIGEYASQHEWTDKRDKHRKNTVKKTTEKIAELTSDEAAQATARHFNASNKLLEILEGAINVPGEFNKVVEKLRVGEFGEEEVQVVEVNALAEKRLATVVTSLASIQKMQRETLDIKNAKEEKAIQQAQLNIDKTREEKIRLQKLNEAGNQQNTEEKLAEFFTALQGEFTNEPDKEEE